jgi:signal peptidase I
VSDGLDIDLQQHKEEETPKKTNWLWDMISSWGPPLLVVLLLRSIVVEPFQIPSGSMVPTLAIGDFILVSKFSYGLHLPFWGMRMVGIGIPFTDIQFVKFEEPLRMPEWYREFEVLGLGEPERGDIMVFVYPPTQDTTPTDYIKRLVGLPGDTIEVRDDVVYVNGEEQRRTPAGPYSYVDSGRGCRPEDMQQFQENLGGRPHDVLQSTSYATRLADWGPQVVPEGHYFMMGDNRDNSMDSRFWGFVPRDNLRGKAVLVWLSFDRCSGNIPALGRLRFERIGISLTR